jgi:L-asparagine oxygenase
MSPTEELSAKAAQGNEYMRRHSPGVEGAIRIRRPDPVGPAPSVLRLEAAESDLLGKLAAELLPGPGERPDRYCEEAALLAAKLPTSVRTQLRRFSLNGAPEGFLVVRNLPADTETPPRPVDEARHLGERTLVAGAQAIVGQTVGELVGYEGEGEGRIFQDVVAAPDEGEDIGGSSARPRTERAHSPLRPDFVSVACLSGRFVETTYVLDARTLLKALDHREQGLTREPLWTTRPPGSPGRDSEARVGPLPIIEGSDEDPLIRFDAEVDWGIVPEAERLRLKIAEVYRQLRTSHTLIPGELLLIDNRRAVFERTVVDGGSDQFALRAYLVRDLVKSRCARFGNGRVIGARFG